MYKTELTKRKKAQAKLVKLEEDKRKEEDKKKKKVIEGDKKRKREDGEKTKNDGALKAEDGAPKKSRLVGKDAIIGLTKLDIAPLAFFEYKQRFLNTHQPPPSLDNNDQEHMPSLKGNHSHFNHPISIPALVIIILADLFVVQLLLDKVLRALQTNRHRIISSILQLLQMTQWSSVA